MANDLVNKPGLKLVPKPDPSSLTQEDRLLLLRRGNPTGGFRLDCGPARPYLVVISTGAPDPTKEPGDSTSARAPQGVTSPSTPEVEAPVSTAPRLWHQFCNRTLHIPAIPDVPTSLLSPDSKD